MGTTQSKAGSVAGPFILIAVGILFLLHNLTGFNVFHLISPVLASDTDCCWRCQTGGILSRQQAGL